MQTRMLRMLVEMIKNATTTKLGETSNVCSDVLSKITRITLIYKLTKACGIRTMYRERSIPFAYNQKSVNVCLAPNPLLCPTDDILMVVYSRALRGQPANRGIYGTHRLWGGHGLSNSAARPGAIPGHGWSQKKLAWADETLPWRVWNGYVKCYPCNGPGVYSVYAVVSGAHAVYAVVSV